MYSFIINEYYINDWVLFTLFHFFMDWPTCCKHRQIWSRWQNVQTTFVIRPFSSSAACIVRGVIGGWTLDKAIHMEMIFKQTLISPRSTSMISFGAASLILLTTEIAAKPFILQFQVFYRSFEVLWQLHSLSLQSFSCDICNPINV